MRVGKTYIPTYATLRAWCIEHDVKPDALAELADITREAAKNIFVLPVKYPAHADDCVPWRGTAVFWTRICAERPKDGRRSCAHCDAPLLADRATKKFCSARCRVAAGRDHAKSGKNDQ